jgi:precorrin-6A/cobalt-precorrin-6A reductase
VFLTIGRQEIAAFASLDDCWFLARSVEPPAPPMPARMSVVLDRGPFSVASETALMRSHRIDVVVSKDSGGAPAKLAAARDLGLPVVLVDRPPLPTGVEAVETVAEALGWLTARRP